MASRPSALEAKLDELFLRNIPNLPHMARRAVASWMPILSLVASAFAIVSAWNAWHWMHTTGKFIGVCNAYSVSGCGNLTVSHASFWLWITLGLIITEAILYILAYPGLRYRHKEGWTFILYAMLCNAAFAAISLFTDYAKYSHFFGGLFVSGIGLYLLFQIRGLYGVRKPSAVRVPPTPEPAKLADRLKQTGKQQ